MTDPTPTTGPTLCREDGEARMRLARRSRVGRSRHNEIQLDDPSVSSGHARIDWHVDGWTLRDLGSRNGTRVDGVPVPSGGEALLSEGSLIEFAQDPAMWVLVDARSPDASAPRPLDRTLFTATTDEPLTLTDCTFVFRVSRDEETAGWAVRLNHQEVDLGERAHAYLMLTLARLRLDDNALPEAERGWTYGDPLAKRLRITPDTLKMQVYRARRQLQSLVLGAAGVVERRPSTNQIRFGADHIEVERS